MVMRTLPGFYLNSNELILLFNNFVYILGFVSVRFLLSLDSRWFSGSFEFTFGVHSVTFVTLWNFH